MKKYRVILTEAEMKKLNKLRNNDVTARNLKLFGDEMKNEIEYISGPNKSQKFIDDIKIKIDEQKPKLTLYINVSEDIPLKIFKNLYHDVIFSFHDCHNTYSFAPKLKYNMGTNEYNDKSFSIIITENKN